MKKKKTGAPPRYKTPEEMQEMIDQYFERCKGRAWTDPDTGEVCKDKYGLPVILDAEPPTITGLALALGFTSRQALLNYQAKEAFIDTVTRAKARVEHYTEVRLFDKEGCSGAKFSLSNNFRGWSDKQELSHSGTMRVELADELKEWAQ